MKKSIRLVLPVLIPLVLVFITSCKDDEPQPSPKLSFAEESQTVAENAGTIEIEVKLDRAYSRDIVVEYEISGTAAELSDFEVLSDAGEVTIEKGSTTGIIELEILSDGLFEADETIELKIEDVDADDIIITSDDEMVITITNDDAPVTASFVNTTLTVNEDLGFIQDTLVAIKVQLDKPAPSDITINYTLGGTAFDSVAAVNDENLSPDYAISRSNGTQLTVPSGESTGTIYVRIYFDFTIENNETIEITLEESADVTIGAANKSTITLEQQDGLVAELVWPDTINVDMDLFLWIGASENSIQNLVAGSAFGSTTETFENIIIPYSIPDSIYFGMSYVYYSGNASPLDFEVYFIDFVDGEPEDPSGFQVFEGTYTTANRNTWTNPLTTQVVQTFTKLDGEFVNFSEIETPSSGSRARTVKIPANTKRQSANFMERLSLKSYFK